MPTDHKEKHMIKVMNQQIFDDNFMAALEKVSTMDAFSIRPAYNIAKIRDKIYKLGQEAFGLRQKLVEKFAVRGEDGKLQVAEDNPNNVVIDPAKVEEFRKEMQEFMAIAHEIPRSKLTEADLTHAQERSPVGKRLTAKDLSVLGPILEMEEDQVAAS
jgi:hypothetical protein